MAPPERRTAGSPQSQVAATSSREEGRTRVLTTNQVAMLLVGGALVALGIVAGAVADRIRGIRANRTTPRPLEPRQRESTRALSPDLRLRADVVAALAGAGYTKRQSELAADACAPSERATIEAWTRAALKRALEGAPS